MRMIKPGIFLMSAFKNSAGIASCVRYHVMKRAQQAFKWMEGLVRLSEPWLELLIYSPVAPAQGCHITVMQSLYKEF